MSTNTWNNPEVVYCMSTHGYSSVDKMYTLPKIVDVSVRVFALDDHQVYFGACYAYKFAQYGTM